MKCVKSFTTSMTSKSLKRAPSFGGDSNLSLLSDTMSLDNSVVQEVPPTTHLEDQLAKRLRKQSCPVSPMTTGWVNGYVSIPARC